MQKLQSIPELGFIGMNNTANPEYLKEGFLTLVRNGLTGNRRIEKGPGTTLFTSYTTGGLKPILGAISTKSEIYFAINNTANTAAHIYRYTGSGSPELVLGTNLVANAEINFINAGTAVYVLDGTTATGKLVGATYSQPAGMPIGKYAAWVNNRLYITGNTSNKDRLYYSNLNVPDTFGVSDFIDIFASLKSNNTSLASFNSQLQIGKDDNVVTFDGFTEDDFTAKQLSENLPNYGVKSHRSMVVTDDYFMFLSFSGGIPHIRAMKKTSFGITTDIGIISSPIETTMSRITLSRLSQVSGGFDGRYAWWSIPVDESTTNNLTISVDTVDGKFESWSEHTGIDANVFFRSSISGQDRFYYGDANSTSKLKQIDPSIANREGEALTLTIHSRYYRPSVSRKSKFKYTYVVADEIEGTSIAVSASPDGYTAESQGTISASQSASSFPFTFPLSLGATTKTRRRLNMAIKQAYTMQLQMTETSTQKIYIDEWDVLYQKKGYRDA